MFLTLYKIMGTSNYLDSYLSEVSADTTHWKLASLALSLARRRIESEKFSNDVPR
jgi:hypothetical protein